MNVWLVVYRFAAVAFVAVVIVGVVSLFLPKLRANEEYQRKVSALEEANRVKEQDVNALRKQQDRFLTDPVYVEKIAREDLGKAKPGETIFRFSDRRTNDFRPRP